MKKLFTLIAAFIIAGSSYAQSPDKMSYQAVIRDASDLLVTNQAIGMQVSILQGSASGTAVFVETQTPTSNVNGLVSIEIGAGTNVSGAINTIDWSNGPYFIKTETDPTGGTSYTITGTSQLLSVPYALNANSLTGGIDQAYIDALEARIEALEPPQIGDFIHGGVVFWVDGNGGGLVCTVEDINTGGAVPWSNNNAVTGAFDTLVGSGESNTTMIVNTQGAGTYGAKLCRDLSLNGFSDWFLPSRDELNEMFLNKSVIETTSLTNGGASFSLFYWSSSEVNGNANLCFSQSFSFGQQYQSAKLNTANVRAVRAF